MSRIQPFQAVNMPDLFVEHFCSLPGSRPAAAAGEAWKNDFFDTIVESGTGSVESPPVREDSLEKSGGVPYNQHGCTREFHQKQTVDHKRAHNRAITTEREKESG